jgi:SAM-dependent methyltransferase
MTWSEYDKWSFSLVRDVLAHLEYLLNVLILSFRGKALEIGCGTGLHSCFISYFSIKVTSIDVDKKVIKLASKISHIIRGKDLNFVVADARNLPFRDKVFKVFFHKDYLSILIVILLIVLFQKLAELLKMLFLVSLQTIIQEKISVMSDC